MYAYPVLRIYFLYYLLLLCYLVVYCVARLLIPPHKSSWFRDPTAQTTDGGIHSAEPSFLSSSGLTPRGVATTGAQHFKTWLLSANYFCHVNWAFILKSYEPV